MPPALLTRSTHHSVPRRPAVPTGAAMPARMASTPILTGSDGTPGLAWARATAGKPTAPTVAAAPATFRKSRLVVAIAFPLVVESRWLAAEPLARERHARREALELLECDPARHREEAAVRDQREPLDRDVLETERHPVRDVLGSLHVEALHVNHPAGDVAVDADLLPHLDLGHLPVGVLEHELVAAGLEEPG